MSLSIWLILFSGLILLYIYYDVFIIIYLSLYIHYYIVIIDLLLDIYLLFPGLILFSGSGFAPQLPRWGFRRLPGGRGFSPSGCGSRFCTGAQEFARGLRDEPPFLLPGAEQPHLPLGLDGFPATCRGFVWKRRWVPADWGSDVGGRWRVLGARKAAAPLCHTRLSAGHAGGSVAQPRIKCKSRRRPAFEPKPAVPRTRRTFFFLVCNLLSSFLKKKTNPTLNQQRSWAGIFRRGGCPLSPGWGSPLPPRGVP